MKRIMLSLLTIAMVATMATGATGAIFTSDVEVSGITVATGTLKIVDNSADWMQGVDFSGLKPGSLIRKWVVIENTGTLDVGTLTVSAEHVTDPAGLMHKLTGWTYAAIVDSSDDQNGVQLGYNNDASVLLNDANLLTPANKVLHPGQKTKVQVQFVVPSELDNNWQGKTAKFDLEFHAEQVN